MASSPHLDETTSASVFSPSVVRDEEFLIREVCDPEHWDSNGNLVETAIPVRDLRERGFSVHRRTYTTAEFVKQAIQERCGKPRQNGPWKEYAAVLKAEEVRSIRIEDEDGQALVVIDTALEDNRAHASIYVATPKRSKRDAKRARTYLLPFLRLCLTVEGAFQDPPPGAESSL